MVQLTLQEKVFHNEIFVPGFLTITLSARNMVVLINPLFFRFFIRSNGLLTNM